MFEWDFHLLPRVDTCAKYHLSRLIRGLAREGDVQTYVSTDRSQEKILLTQSSSGGARAWVVQFIQLPAEVVSVADEQLLIAAFNSTEKAGSLLLS